MGLPLSYNWRNVWRRKSRTAFTVLGIALAIFISLMMLALSKGIRGSIQNTAQADNVLVLVKGAETIEFSAIDRSVLEAVRFSDLVAEKDGQRLASPEAYFTTTVDVPGSAAAQGLIRGVLPVSLLVHRQARVTEGRFPSNPGEIMVGPLAATKLGIRPDALQIGKEVRFEGQSWNIVGHFMAPGTALESEIWSPLDDIMVTSRREEYSVIAVTAKSASAVPDMVFDFSTRRDILVDARSETDYYRSYADSFRPVELMATLMTVMLIIGGIVTGMNTFLAAVLGRVREIGMLRTLGYTKRAVLVSFVFEALLIALTGGIVGSLFALTLNGLPMRAFRFQVDVYLVALGLGLSGLIGLLGVAWPLLRATRLTIVNAIRQL